MACGKQCLTAFLVILTAFSAPVCAYAQQETAAAPEVFVDTGVLESLGTPRTPQKQVPQLRPPASYYRPMLTVPEPQPQAYRPVLRPPPPQAAPAMQPPVKKQAIRKQQPKPLPAALQPPKVPPTFHADFKPQPLPLEQPGNVREFPIQDNVTRHDTMNPAAGVSERVLAAPVTAKPAAAPVSKPVPVVKFEPKPLPLPAPVPVSKPVPVTRKAEVQVPLPPRRPEVQKASEAFVAKARAAQGLDAPKENRIAATAASRPKIKGRVYAQPLEPALREGTPQAHMPGDYLAHNLVTPDREKLVETIDAIANRKPMPRVPEMSEDEMTAVLEPAAGNARAPILPRGGLNLPLKSAARPDNVPRPPPELEGLEKEFISMPYGAGITETGKAMEEEIASRILPLMKGNDALRLQIQSFASPADAGVSSARRVSLTRALAVRSYLLDKGIEPHRMDVRAMGAQTDREPADRVDLVLFQPEVN